MAADLTQNFWGKHFEKIVLAAAAILFVAAAIFFVFGPTHQDRLRLGVTNDVGNLQKPSEPVTLDKVLTPAEKSDLGIGQPPVTVKDYIGELNGLAAAWDATHDWTETRPAPTNTGEKLTPFHAPRVVNVTNLQVVTGRGTTDEAAPKPVFVLEQKPLILSDIVFNGIVGLVDLTDQLDAFKAADDPVQPIMLSRVELQRRELKADSTWSPWQAVTPAVTATAAAKWPKLPANPRNSRAVMQWGAAVGIMQAAIRHMPLYHLVAVDEEGRLVESVAGSSTGTEQPDLTPPKPVEPAPAASDVGSEDTGPAAPPPESVTGEVNPWAAPATGPATKTGPAAPIAPPPPREPSKRATTTVWAYDTTVEPGKTYQYQMRIGIRSPIYSLERADPAARWQPEFMGEWSEPTRDVTPLPTVFFYFVGVLGDKANIDLQRWILGQWVHVPSTPISLGAPIVANPPLRRKLTVPGTKAEPTKDNVEIDMNPVGIVLVDILHNFLYQPAGTRAVRTDVLMFADGRGELGERFVWDDKTRAASDWKARETGGTTPPVTPPVTPTTPRPPFKPLPPKPTTPPPPPKAAPTLSGLFSK